MRQPQEFQWNIPRGAVSRVTFFKGINLSVFVGTLQLSLVVFSIEVPVLPRGLAGFILFPEYAGSVLPVS